MSQQLEFTDAEWETLAAEFCRGFTTEQANVCRTFCRLRGLIPGKHVIFSLRRSKEWDEVVGAKVEVTKIIFMTTIDAARLIALRSDEYEGQDPEKYIYLKEDGSDFIESNIPLPQLPIVKGVTALPREPWAVRTTVYRKSFTHPMISVARFDAYASTYKYNGVVQLTEMWQKRGPEQLAKCSEMLSLRKAFPEELGSLYLAEEFKNEAEDEKPHGITPASVVPLPPPVPAVNQTPAVPTDAPRPNEKVTVHPVVEVKVPKETPEIKPESAVRASVKEVVLATVPGLKPASELPPPAKKRGGRPKKDPDNGRDVSTEGGITDADIANASQPQPEFDEAANKKEAEEFVDAVSNMTETEATVQGLPDPPEYSKLPEKAERDSFISRTRALPEPGADIKSIGDYMLLHANKVGQPSKNLTVKDWTEALALLEEAKKAGTLKELLKEAKNVPLPAEF
jgi:hypothetical protein